MSGRKRPATIHGARTPVADLSPTTQAGVAGMRLNDPALSNSSSRGLSVSRAQLQRGAPPKKTWARLSSAYGNGSGVAMATAQEGSGNRGTNGRGAYRDSSSVSGCVPWQPAKSRQRQNLGVHLTQSRQDNDSSGNGTSNQCQTAVDIRDTQSATSDGNTEQIQNQRSMMPMAQRESAGSQSTRQFIYEHTVETASSAEPAKRPSSSRSQMSSTDGNSRSVEKENDQPSQANEVSAVVRSICSSDKAQQETMKPNRPVGLVRNSLHSQAHLFPSSSRTQVAEEGYQSNTQVDISGLHSSDYQNFRYEDDDGGYEDGNDELSEESGNTVVADYGPSPPGQNATRDEWNRYYWELCYGPANSSDSQTVMRAFGVRDGMKSAPAKSCLSTGRRRGHSKRQPALTPRRLHQSPVDGDDTSSSSTAGKESEDTQLLTPTEEGELQDQQQLLPTQRKTAQSAVKFGTNSAAEFDLSRPISEMTPLPTATVEALFPTGGKKRTEQDETVSRETARNMDILAEWEDDFDLYADEDGEGGAGGSSRKKRGRKRGTPYKSDKKNRRRNRTSSFSRPKKSRRESSMFSRTPKNLVDESRASLDESLDSSMEIDDENTSNGRRSSLMQLQSVAIDPEEHTSPSIAEDAMLPANSENETIVEAKSQPPEGRDSLDSACISIMDTSLDTTLDTSVDSKEETTRVAVEMPSGLDTGVGVNTSVDTEDGNGIDVDDIDKATPNSARRSSSTVLRNMHASGALVPSVSHSPPTVSVPTGGGRLRPNHLKYSPSSSSGSSRSSGSGRMETSPCDSDTSLGSDIMSLFTHHSLNETTEEKGGADAYSLSTQLSIFSRHAMQPHHLSMTDLIQWIGSSSISNKEDLFKFLKECLGRGLSLQTCLALITGDEKQASMFTGESTCLESALCQDDQQERKGGESNYTQLIFESMIVDEMSEICSRDLPSRSDDVLPTQLVDTDNLTLPACIREVYMNAALSWTRIELDVSIRAFNRLQELTDSFQQENQNCNSFVNKCCEQLIGCKPLVENVLSKSSCGASRRADAVRRRTRKRLLESQVEEEIESLQLLEKELHDQVQRLNQCQATRQLLDANLELERSSPISALCEEIRSSLVPAPVTHNASDFVYSLLDGSAEVVLKVETPDETGNQSVDIGCFIKEGGASVQLLQAFLLGNMETRVNESVGPFTLRDILTSLIVDGGGREALFVRTSHLLFRLDSLVQSVRDLETFCFCNVSACANSDVVLSITAQHQGCGVQLGFRFHNLLGASWQYVVVPTDVTVVIASPGGDSSELTSQLQAKASALLTESVAKRDPGLVRRISNIIVQEAS